MQQKYIRNIIPAIFFLFQSCTSYNTHLNEMETIQLSAINDIIKGEACSKNLFGGFTLPYFGDTAIKLGGDESVISAAKNANINRIYAIDRLVNNYVFYSKRCTIVFGQKILDTKLEEKSDFSKILSQPKQDIK